jgi:flagellum-specific peptidoglycan hydrolase FlgJ
VPGSVDQASQPAAQLRPTAATTSFDALLKAVQQELSGQASGDQNAAMAVQMAKLLSAGVKLDPQAALALSLGNSPDSLLSGLLNPSDSGSSDEVDWGALQLPVQLPPPATAAVNARSAVTGSAADRFASLKPAFVQAEKQTGVPWQIQAAQWALESGWGKATPKDMGSGKESYNLFGVKGEGPAGAVQSATIEFENGRFVPRVARFRAYNSYQESITEHAQLLNSPYYAKAHAAGRNLQGWADQLQSLGYATDPSYSQKLMNIIRENGWDKQ